MYQEGWQHQRDQHGEQHPHQVGSRALQYFPLMRHLSLSTGEIPASPYELRLGSGKRLLSQNDYKLGFLNQSEAKTRELVHHKPGLVGPDEPVVCLHDDRVSALQYLCSWQTRSYSTPSISHMHPGQHLQPVPGVVIDLLNSSIAEEAIGSHNFLA